MTFNLGKATDAISSFGLADISGVRETESSQADGNARISPPVKAWVSIVPSDRNSRLPIHRPPVEVLIVIFELVLLDHEPYDEPGAPSHSSVLRTLRLVSAYWDKVIDQAPTLWAVTSCVDPDWAVKRALQRSKHSLLSVSCKCGALGWKICNYAALVLPHSNRWWSLQLSSADLQKFDLFLNAPVPNLRHISIGLPSRYSENQVNVMLPETAQSLRTVGLKNVSLSLGEVVYTNIRNLRLNGSRGQGLSVDHLLCALMASAKSLRELDLSNSVIKPSQSNVARIPLPNLRQFSFRHCTPESMAKILKAVDYPDGTKVEIAMEFGAGTGLDAVKHVGDKIARAVARGTQLPLTVLFVERTGIVFAFNNIRLGLLLREENYEETVDVMELQLGMLRSAMEEYLGPALKNSVLWIKLEFIPAAHPPEPTGELNGLDRVLNICHSSFPKAPGLIILGESVIHTLQCLARPIQKDGHQSWLFPEMESVWIEGYKFDTTLPKCIELIQRRHEARSAKSIRELKVACKHCSIDDVISSPLRQLVPNLIATKSHFTRR